MSPMRYVPLVLGPTLLQMVGLILLVQLSSYIKAEYRRRMIAACTLVITMIMKDYLTSVFSFSFPSPRMLFLVRLYGYIAQPVILALFVNLSGRNRKLRFPWILVGVNAAVYLTALFSRVVFWVDEDCRLYTGVLSYLSPAVSILLLFIIASLSFRMMAEREKKSIWVLVLSIVIVLGALIGEFMPTPAEAPIKLTTIAALSGCSTYSIWLQHQFVLEHERDLMAEQRIQIMLSQIKPHFLYNSLGAIEELCDSDPQTAKLATATFSRYLRGNMDSITAEGEIPFSRELSHTKIYLELEQLRFEDALQVKYDIACSDFSIPALTLEPLAENAVFHGVRENPDGRGTVTIAAREYPDRIEISVADDGPGFDPAEISRDGRPHVGIQNVQTRLTHVSGGDLRIRSEIGRGTTATIVLPKKGGNRHAHSGGGR